jgi:hypothetical protein
MTRRVALMLLSGLIGKQKITPEAVRKLCAENDVLRVDFGNKNCINRIHIISGTDSVWVSVDDLIESLKP